MLRLGDERNELKIVSDQHGVPTYATDLAKACLDIAQNINDKPKVFGTFNYSNEGWVTWHEFAEEIFKLTHNKIKCLPIPTAQYPTPALRPNFSVLNLNKIRPFLSKPISNWRDGLNTCLRELGRLS